MKITPITLLPCLLIIAVITGCASRQAEQVKLDVLFASNQCQYPDAATTLISNAEELTAFTTHIRQAQGTVPGPQIIHSENSSTTSLLQTLSAQQNSIYFDREKLLFIARGNQPNPGYGMELQAETAKLSDGELQIPISILKPEPGQMYAQLIISPCLLLRAVTPTAISKITLQTTD